MSKNKKYIIWNSTGYAMYCILPSGSFRLIAHSTHKENENISKSVERLQKLYRTEEPQRGDFVVNNNEVKVLC